MKKIFLIIFLILAIFQMVAISANLFADDFEGGNLNAWSSSVTDSGDLSAAAGAALHGSYGLNLLIDDTTQIYVVDTTPNNETRYRFRFYVDPNSVIATNGDNISLFRGITSGGSSNIYVALNRTTNLYKIGVETIKTDTTTLATSAYTITDAPHSVEVDWKASSAAGANDGFLELIIDGVSKQTISNIDNDTINITTIHFGAYPWSAAGTPWTFYLDDFASNNDGTAIGVISETPTGNAIMMGVNF